MTADEHTQFEQLWRGPPGWRGTLAAVNNQRIGLRFMITAFVFFIVGGILALLMRIQLAVSDNTFIGPQLYNELFTMHGSTMMYLFAVPFIEGLALYFLPLMIGSRDVAFPRLSAFSYWTYLFGGLIFYASFLTGSVPDAGWFAYTPLSGPGYSGKGLDYWVMGLALVEVAGLAAGVELVVTILKLRAPGMSIRRMPIFAWTILVVGVMMLFAFTVLLVATALLELDRTLGTRFFEPAFGGNSLLWQHLFWFFGHPEVYIMFLPATGIVSMIVATAAHRPLAAYALVAMAIMVTGFVSFGLWMHHMYVTGLPDLGLSFFAAASLMIGVASGIQIFAWIATLWGTRPRLTAAFLYVLGFFFIFVLGGFTGVMVAVAPFDWQVHDTFFIVAHFHYVLIGGVVFPVFAGLHYWLPKLTGRMLNERLGRWGFWLNFIGFNLTFFPMHIMGLLGLPRRVYTYPASLQLDGYNLASTAGAFVLAGGFVLILINFLHSLRRGPPAGDNPWQSGSLEWSMPSPPPVYSFLRPPVVYAREPLWQNPPEHTDSAAEVAADGIRGQPLTWRATLSTDAITGRPVGIQALAGPSLWPLCAACGLAVAFLGVLFQSYLLIPLGAVFAVASFVRWLYPSDQHVQELHTSDLPTKTGLPVALTGRRSTAWWGMLGFLTIGATGFGALFYSYFYLWLFSEAWPQGGLPLPDLMAGAMAYAPLTASAGVLWWARRAHVRGDKRQTLLSFAGVAFLWILFLVIEGRNLATAPFDVRLNAYASIFCLISATLLLFVVSGLILLSATATRAWRTEPWDFSVTLPVELTAMFGYFVAAAGVAIFGVLYLAPRFL